MTDWAKIFQGKTDDNRCNIPANLTRGFLGGLAVYALSKTSRPGTAIAAAAATAAVVSVADQTSNRLWTFKKGVTPVYRAFQLYAAYYALSHRSFAWAAAAVAEPIITSGIQAHGATEGKKLEAFLQCWGVLTVAD